MRHDSTEFLFVEITGPEDWANDPVHMSLDDGATWVLAEADMTTKRTVTLPTGEDGDAVWVRALSSEFDPFEANTTVPVLVRITADEEVPVLSAGSLAIT